MKVIILLSVLGLAVGCGTDVNHTRTLASEEEIEQTKKDNRALKIAGITAGVALAGCVIVGLVKKKCISFAKKVTRNVEDVTTTKSVDPSKRAASESAGVSGAKPKQGDEPDLDNVQKEAKDSEVKEQEVQTTAESSSAKPKQSDEPDLEDTKKEAKDSEVKEEAERVEFDKEWREKKLKDLRSQRLEKEWREVVDPLNDVLIKETPESKVVGLRDSIAYSRTVDAELSYWLREGKITAKEVDIFRDQSPFYVKNWKEHLVPKDLVQARKAMEEAGIPVSFETFEKMRKNMENANVLPSDTQVVSFLTLGRDVLTEENMQALREAHAVGFMKIWSHYTKFTARAREIAEKANHEGFPHYLHHRLAARQLVEEGILTDEIAKQVETAYNTDWLPVTELFK